MSVEQQKPRMNWHTADIIAALRKRKTTLAALSREAGLSSSTLANALNRLNFPQVHCKISQQ